MSAHLWELRADVRPLEDAADRWSEMGQLMTWSADQLVGAARLALDGWDACAADGYDRHRRQVIADLDVFTTLTGDVAATLRAVSSMITTAQNDLDRAWLAVSLVPHQVVGPDRRLVFAPSSDEHRTTVAHCQLEAEEIRQRLTALLDQERNRLRDSRAELVGVRASLVVLARGSVPPLRGRGIDESSTGGSVTSARAVVEAGVGVRLAPAGLASVLMPHVEGLAPGAVPALGVAVGGAAGRRGSASSDQPSGGMPPVGGGVGGGAVRGASSLGNGRPRRRTGARTVGRSQPTSERVDEVAPDEQPGPARL